jgi:hypothetical protein
MRVFNGLFLALSDVQVEFTEGDETNRQVFDSITPALVQNHNYVG